MRKIILDKVNNSTGIKAVELVVAVQTEVKSEFQHDEYVKTIEELVSSKEIVELDYILPSMNYRVKSLYFPKGTVFPNK